MAAAGEVVHSMQYEAEPWEDLHVNDSAFSTILIEPHFGPHGLDFGADIEQTSFSQSHWDPLLL